MRRDCACPRAQHKHGTWHAYAADDCRCPACKRAWMHYGRDLRKRRYLNGGKMLIDGTGTARRLQALSANGWGCPDLARELGLTRFIVEQWRAGAPVVTVATHQKIAALYERLWDKPTPCRYQVKVRRIAAAKGWLPPMAWDDDTIDTAEIVHTGHESEADGPHVDDIAVAEAIAGRRVALTSREKTEAIRRMTDAGYSASAIADRLGTSGRAVTRRRSAAA